MRAGFVEKMKTLGSDLANFLDELALQLLNILAFTLGGREGFFFRLKLSLSNARLIVDVLIETVRRSRSTSTNCAIVRSGFSLTSSPIQRSFSSSNIGFGPLPRARGATEPVSRSRRNQRFTVAIPMLKNNAVCAYVQPYSRRASTTRFRKSIEYPRVSLIHNGRSKSKTSVNPSF
jgi:hypothetical protein